MPLRHTLRHVLHHHLQTFAGRLRARSPDAAIHAETITDTRGVLRLWRWRSSDAINREEPS